MNSCASNIDLPWLRSVRPRTCFYAYLYLALNCLPICDPTSATFESKPQLDLLMILQNSKTFSNSTQETFALTEILVLKLWINSFHLL